jgi:hypothetical protein
MGNFMRLISNLSKSYAYVRLMQKTGMNIEEVILFRDTMKTCNKYYSKKCSYMIKSIFQSKKCV